MLRKGGKEFMNKFKKISVNKWIDLAILILLIVFPVFVKPFRVEMMGRFVAFAIFAIALDLLWGYTGLMSLGHAVLFGMGGYMVAICYSIQNGVPAFMTRAGITEIPAFFVPLQTPAVAVIIGLILPVVFAIILGYFLFTSKVSGVFFTIITLALAQVFKDFIINQQKFTNGFNGLQGIPRFPINGTPLTKIQLYYIILVFAIMVYIFCNWLTKSRFGKVAISIRENESRLAFFGYKPANFKIAIFGISGFIAGLAGILYTPMTNGITPEDIGVSASTAVLLWLAVGGRGNITGAIVGTLLINWAQSLLSEHFADYWQLILGLILLIIIFFVPNGIIGKILEQQYNIRINRNKAKIAGKIAASEK